MMTKTDDVGQEL